MSINPEKVPAVIMDCNNLASTLKRLGGKTDPGNADILVRSLCKRLKQSVTELEKSLP